MVSATNYNCTRRAFCKRLSLSFANIHLFNAATKSVVYFIIIYSFLCYKCWAHNFHLVINPELPASTFEKYALIVKTPNQTYFDLKEALELPLFNVNKDTILINRMYLKPINPSASPSEIVLFENLTAKELTDKLSSKLRCRFSEIPKLYKYRQFGFQVLISQADNITIRRGIAVSAYEVISYRAVFEYNTGIDMSISMPDIQISYPQKNYNNSFLNLFCC